MRSCVHVCKSALACTFGARVRLLYMSLYLLNRSCVARTQVCILSGSVHAQTPPEGMDYNKIVKHGILLAGKVHVFTPLVGTVHVFIPLVYR